MSSNDTKKLELLDCTLRDGAYIVDAHFGVAADQRNFKKVAEIQHGHHCVWMVKGF